jgi:hypothetical protein
MEKKAWVGIIYFIQLGFIETDTFESNSVLIYQQSEQSLNRWTVGMMP